MPRDVDLLQQREAQARRLVMAGPEARRRVDDDDQRAASGLIADCVRR